MGESPANLNDQDHARLRAAAVSVLEELVSAGHEAYFAGGCVRDRLMGHLPDDYDIATNARPEEIAKVFRRAHGVGESFGVMLVRMDQFVMQIATFRTDGVYSDGRHPDSVSFSDARHDAQRRDFTINGLFENPLTNEIIDFVGGQADLKNRVIRAIGDPQARLREDHLRMLRAIRFAARFGFSIEESTADAIRAGGEHLRGVSRERIGQEVKRMLTHPNRAVAAWEMQYLGLDGTVLLEPPSMVAPTRLGRLPDDVTYDTALAAWLLDRHQADSDWEGIARRWGLALMLSNEELTDMLRCLDTLALLGGPWFRMGVARQKRLAASPGFNAALLLVQAIDRQAFVDIRRRVIDLSQTGLAPQALIDGNDLITLGLTPGPRFKQVLEAVYDAQLEGSIQDKPGALAMAKAIASAIVDDGAG